jgi:glycosyltransferase involved in cell wall biosynthesis
MNKKIKVCHFSSVHKDNDIRIYAKECLSLAGAGYDTILIACDGQQTSGSVKLIKVKEEGSRFKRIFLRSYRVYKTAKLIKADVYHFHDPELLPYGIILKYTTNSKIIYDSHECYPEDLLNKDWLPKFARIIIAKIYTYLEDFSSRKLDLVIAATPYIAKRFENVAKNLVTINNYPKIEEFNIPATTGESQRDGVCYVGAITIIRGIMPFLDSLDFIDSNVKIYIAGSFADNNTKKLVYSHKNWRKVEFHGQVSRIEIHEIFAKSFAGIVNFQKAPNHEYSQPNKLFEYMEAGIPVIGSNFKLWKEIIETTNCGLTVQPDSPLDIGNAINKLHNDKDLSKKMGAAGVNAIRDRFSWEHEKEILINAYKKINQT